MDKPTSIERVQHILDAIQLIGQFVEGENESYICERRETTKCCAISIFNYWRGDKAY